MEKLTCENCDAKCCRYIATEIDKPEKKQEYEEIIWYLLHENVSVFIDEGEWYIQFDTPCKEIGEKGECKIYNKRPEICRDLKINNCEKYGDGEPYEIIFNNPEEFVKYMKDNSVDIDF